MRTSVFQVYPIIDAGGKPPFGCLPLRLHNFFDLFGKLIYALKTTSSIFPRVRTSSQGWTWRNRRLQTRLGRGMEAGAREHRYFAAHLDDPPFASGIPYTPRDVLPIGRVKVAGRSGVRFDVMLHRRTSFVPGRICRSEPSESLRLSRSAAHRAGRSGPGSAQGRLAERETRRAGESHA